MNFENKIILITGGAGSFGQKFVEIILKEHNPKVVRIYDNRELAEVEMERKLKDPRMRFLIGDVRDRSRLNRAMNGVDIVVHAAALKHVPVCEHDPLEAVKTNIKGTINVIDAAVDNIVEKAIIISTDKAVHPVNLYGATKMVAEKLFIQGNWYVGERRTILSCARYGNVVGSSGSVVPLFLKQKKEGAVTITDERMTRFWIDIEQGIRFVIKCIETMKGGEVFVPKIPSMKIMDLAEAIAPGVKKNFCGIRPGEKLHEVLITKEEAVHTKEFKDYFVIEPEDPFRATINPLGGKPLPDDFEYTSKNNGSWITKEQVREILKNVKTEDLKIE